VVEIVIRVEIEPLSRRADRAADRRLTPRDGYAFCGWPTVVAGVG